MDTTPDGVLLPSGGTSTLQLTTESFGCVESASLVLKLPPLPNAEFEIITPPCRGLTVEFANLAPSLGPFTWTFGDGSTGSGSNPVHIYDQFGPYTIQAIAGEGTACADTAWQAFSVYPLDPFEPAFDIRPIASCDDTSRVQITYLGQPADGIAWVFGSMEVAEGSPVVLPFDAPGMQTGWVNLYHEGCDLVVQYPLEVEALEPIRSVTYEVPNVFSPNNDGRNERFEVNYVGPSGETPQGLTNASFTLHHLAIYNRWGGLMYETDQALAGWWGTGATDGTYYVVVDSQHLCAAAPFHYHGEVTLVR